MRGPELVCRVRCLKDIVARASGHFVQIATIGGENFSAYILLEPNARMKAGDVVEVPCGFLAPEMVLPLLKVGMRFPLHQVIHTLAEIEVLEITEDGRRFQAVDGKST
ncbi:MAG: hypothetical protein WDO18_16745 [Acidobacteriota bacterium]